MSRPSGERCTETSHASCVVLGEDGVLVRGASGAGKSALCLALIERWNARGRHARLVGDDRIGLSACHGRLVARPHPALAGLIEIRGAGVARLDAHAEAGVVRLVVDLVADLPRMPDEADATVPLMGLQLPVLRLAALQLEHGQSREYLIDEALVALQRRRHGTQSVSRQTHSKVLSARDAGNP